jgi:hypothetical protein
MQPHSIDWDYSAFLVVEIALSAKFMDAILKKGKIFHCDGLHSSELKGCSWQSVKCVASEKSHNAL